MIGIIFQFVNEIIEVRIDGNSVYFRNNPTMGFATIEGLQLNKVGVLKEFPDLKGKVNWREEAIKRFKEKIKSMNTEDEKAKYIINDLGKHGYKAIALQKKGFRVKKLI